MLYGMRIKSSVYYSKGKMLKQAIETYQKENGLDEVTLAFLWDVDLSNVYRIKNGTRKAGRKVLRNVIKHTPELWGDFIMDLMEERDDG